MSAVIMFIIKRLPGYRLGRIAGLKEAGNLVHARYEELYLANRQPNRNELGYIAFRIFRRTAS